MAAGDTYGASLAGSASSGASQSGATSFAGGTALGPSYGPGSVVFGPTPSILEAAGGGIGGLIGIGLLLFALWIGYKMFVKGKV